MSIAVEGLAPPPSVQSLRDVAEEAQVAVGGLYALVARMEMVVRNLRPAFSPSEGEWLCEAEGIEARCQNLIEEGTRLRETCEQTTLSGPVAGRPQGVLSGARWKAGVSQQINQERRAQYRRLQALWRDLESLMNRCAEVSLERRQQIEAVLAPRGTKAAAPSASAAEVGSGGIVGFSVEVEGMRQDLPPRVNARARAGSASTRPHSGGMGEGSELPQYLDLAGWPSTPRAMTPVNLSMSLASERGQAASSREGDDPVAASGERSVAVLPTRGESSDRLARSVQERLREVAEWQDQILALAGRAAGELVEPAAQPSPEAELDPLPFPEGVPSEIALGAAGEGMTCPGPAPVVRAGCGPVSVPASGTALRRGGRMAAGSASPGVLAAVWRVFAVAARAIGDCASAVKRLFQRLWNRLTLRTAPRAQVQTHEPVQTRVH